jgi:hypothetical protein
MQNFSVKDYITQTAKSEQDLEYIIGVCQLMRSHSLYRPAIELIDAVETEARLRSQKLYVSKNISESAVNDFGIIPNIDIIVTEHCNLNCATCGHFAPIVSNEDSDDYNADDLSAVLSKMTKLSSVIGWLFLTGGEPFLNKDLSSLIDAAYTYFPNKIRAVYSNLLLYRENREWFLAKAKETNTVLIGSCYMGHNDEGFDLATQDYNDGEINFKVGGMVPANFGTFPMNPEPVYSVNSKASCYNSRCLALKGNYIYLCCNSAGIAHVNDHFNLNLNTSDFNRIHVDDIEIPEELLVRMLLPNPLCKHCSPSRGQPISWAQSQADRSEWIEE